MKRFSIFKLFKNKKGLTLIEAMIAIVILVFPIMATLSSVSFLYKQTNSRNLELLAENLSNYILEDLRGRKFCYSGEGNENQTNNLEVLYEVLPCSEVFEDKDEGYPPPDPFGSRGNRIMKYSCINDDEVDTSIYDKNNPSDDYPYVTFPSIEARKFYNTFQVEIYITRYIDADMSEPIENYDPYKFIYKIDLVLLIESPNSNYTNLKGTVQGWKRFTVSSTEVTYHDP